MSINTQLFPHTVTKVRPVAGTDTYGNQTLDYGAAAATSDVTGRLVTKTTDRLFDTVQPGKGRDAERETWHFLTNDIDWLADDRIRWTHPARGAIEFEIDGQPMPRYAGNVYNHTKVQLWILEG